MTRNEIKTDYKELAGQYDEQVKDYSSYVFNAIFGMSFEFVSAGEKLLDIGIGTGLASKHFADIGLRVYGLDASPEMLAVCRSKSFAEELTLWELTTESVPYPDQWFEHVISSGVFHFFGDLSGLFSEVKRVMKRGGIFSFTIAPLEASAGYQKNPTAWKVPIFKHSPKYIKDLLEANGMELLKEQRLICKGADKTNYDMVFSVLVCRLQITENQ